MLALLILCLASCWVTGQSLAKTEPSRVVSLRLQETPLRTALHLLAAQSPIYLVYADDLMENIRVTGSLEYLSIEQALQHLLQNTSLTFQYLSDHQIVIMRRSFPERIIGRVINEETGEPLEGASVFFANTTIGTATGMNGRYLLTHVPSGVSELVVSHIGYEPKRLSIQHAGLRPTSQDVEVALTPRVLEVSEIQVVASDEVRAHLEAAVERYDQGDLDGAEAELDVALQLQKRLPPAYYWKGMIALKRGQLKQAEQAFRKANRQDKTWSDPHYGLGLVYLEMKHRKQDALQAFKQTLKLNPQHSEAQYRLASLYLEMTPKQRLSFGLVQLGYLSVVREALERTLTLNPNHPDANHALGVLYEDILLDLQKAIPFYIRQLQVNPNKPETVRRLSLAYFKTGQYREGINTLTVLTRQHSALTQAVHPFLLMLQASLATQTKQYERARTLYDQYLSALSVEERAVYEDLTTIASERERQEYTSLIEPEQAEYQKRFWKQKDPDPITLVNERLLEHYRRVLFARVYFGEQKFPWDRRGGIYVRYGAPDDRQVFTLSVGEKLQSEEWLIAARSVSSEPRTTPDSTGVLSAPPAQTIRERVQAHALERFSVIPTGNPRVDAIRELNRQQRYQLSVEASTLGLSAYKAESWVYGPMGVELFFVDQLSTGVYDLPLPTDGRDIRAVSRQAEYHPERLVREMVKKVPELYYHDYGGEPMRFIFDLTTFRGEGNETQLDIAFGVPINQLGAVSDGKGDRTSFETRVSLMSADWEDAVVTSTQVGPIARPKATRSSHAPTELITFQLPISTLPGEYTIGLSGRDVATRKIGIYRQPVVIPSYSSPELMLSDIKLASAIQPTKQQKGPFIRNGLEIIPNPTRAYAANHPVYLYYELYNLKQDTEGKTNFQAEVTVTPRQKKAPGVIWRLLPGFGRFVQGSTQEHALTFSLVDASTTATIFRYLALDMSGAPPGRYLVEIALADVNANRTVKKTSEFVVTPTVLDETVHTVHRLESEPDSTRGEPGVAVQDSTITTPSALSDSSLASGQKGAGDQTRPSWHELLQILRSPQYTVALGESVQIAGPDSTLSEFLVNLTESLNEQATIGHPREEDEYKDMVYVSVGTFWMGSDSTFTDERPLHQVYTEAFYIDRYEVTNEEYKRFLDATGHPPPRHWVNVDFPPGEAKYPVVGVSWYDADAYAKWADKRLPTEVEWEKAARGPDGRLYPWGDEFLPERLNVGGSSDPYETAAPVGSFPTGVSPYGVLDMAGNVWEWTADWYHPYPGNPVSDSVYGERYRVIRGGSWMNYDLNTRVSNRGKYYPSDTSLLLGFRCAKDSKTPEQKTEIAAGTGRAPSTGYGYLLVATPGTWADIYVDGEKLGQTPRGIPFRLTPGPHELLLVNPFHHEYRRTVLIEQARVALERAVLVRK